MSRILGLLIRRSLLASSLPGQTVDGAPPPGHSLLWHLAGKAQRLADGRRFSLERVRAGRPAYEPRSRSGSGLQSLIHHPLPRRERLRNELLRPRRSCTISRSTHPLIISAASDPRVFCPAVYNSALGYPGISTSVRTTDRPPDGP